MAFQARTFVSFQKGSNRPSASIEIPLERLPEFAHFTGSNISKELLLAVDGRVVGITRIASEIAHPRVVFPISTNALASDQQGFPRARP